MPHSDAEKNHMRQCMDNCHDCHDLCWQTVIHCLENMGSSRDAAHVRLLLDCAQICHTSEDFMLRGSDLHGLTCGVCSEVCTRCAEECERMADDPMMRKCAATCQRCAESCAEMSGAYHLAGASGR
jgi:hypothetical protein